MNCLNFDKHINIGICCEFFYPSVGGVQEVIRQLSIRFLKAGHTITVLTSTIQDRNEHFYCGIPIKSFPISGNLIKGISGSIFEYQNFIKSSNFDLLLIYAAQQWTFDALWELLPDLKMRKILVPCGYSELNNPAYKNYFKKLPKILSQFDAIVYHSKNYRDYVFGKLHGLQNKASIIPNGADYKEFLAPRDPNFRKRLNIPKEAKVLLTVGTLNGAKGHLEVVKAFSKVNFGNDYAVLLLNGNQVPNMNLKMFGVLKKVFQFIKTNSFKDVFEKGISVLSILVGFKKSYMAELQHAIQQINLSNNRCAIICNLPRPDLVQAFLASDLFVFASHIEYSPLVLFESCAAGLPFLSVSVGNAEEIVKWTGGGKVVIIDPDKRGMVKVSPKFLANEIECLIQNPEYLIKLGESGRNSCATKFNWDLIANEYLKLMQNSNIFKN